MYEKETRKETQLKVKLSLRSYQQTHTQVIVGDVVVNWYDGKQTVTL